MKIPSRACLTEILAGLDRDPSLDAMHKKCVRDLLTMALVLHDVRDAAVAERAAFERREATPCGPTERWYAACAAEGDAQRATKDALAALRALEVLP